MLSITDRLSNTYIYVFDGSGWVRNKVIPSPVGPDDRGGSVGRLSDDGSICAVSYPGYTGTYYGQGEVYIYTLHYGEWVSEKILTVVNSSDSVLAFGRSVALSGDSHTLVVTSRKGGYGSNPSGNTSNNIYSYTVYL
jgi:hypothetical protein